MGPFMKKYCGDVWIVHNSEFLDVLTPHNSGSTPNGLYT